MKKYPVATDEAPPVLGPYNQAIRVGNLVFISGQIPLDQDGNRVQGDIVVQTVQVLENIKAILSAAGLSLADVVKTTVFLTDLSDFGKMNPVYAEFFPDDPPARSTVQVADLPRGVGIEIEAIAWKE